MYLRSCLLLKPVPVKLEEESSANQNRLADGTHVWTVVPDVLTCEHLNQDAMRIEISARENNGEIGLRNDKRLLDQRVVSVCHPPTRCESVGRTRKMNGGINRRRLLMR